jgi:hypothetical protein
MVWVLEAVLLGWVLCAAFPDRTARPRLERLLLDCGAGAMIGIGLTSCLFFILQIPILPVRLLEFALIAWAAYRAARSHTTAKPVTETAPLVAAALIVAVGFATFGMMTAWDANPHGGWDAWAIWNLRARFLAAGIYSAPLAWSPQLGSTTHPEYPLLLSAFVARAWAFSHSLSQAVPIATSYICWLALVAMVTGGVAALRGRTLGLLAGLVIAASPSLLHEVPMQMADVPLAAYFAGAVVFLLLDRPALAGILAGFAPWTKDEGWLFLLVFLIVSAVFKREYVLRAIAGALPVTLLAAVFKVWFVRGSSLVSSSVPGVGHRLADPGRYAMVFAAFGRESIAMRAGWYHPILPLIALAVAIGIVRRREALYCAAVAGTMLAGYFAIYLITANDLRWQLGTSLYRLLVQVWPIVVIGVMLTLKDARAGSPAPR